MKVMPHKYSEILNDRKGDNRSKNDELIREVYIVLFGINGHNGIVKDLEIIRKDMRNIYIMLITLIVIMAGIFGERFIHLLK